MVPLVAGARATSAEISARLRGRRKTIGPTGVRLVWAQVAGVALAIVPDERTPKGRRVTSNLSSENRKLKVSKHVHMNKFTLTKL